MMNMYKLLGALAFGCVISAANCADSHAADVSDAAVKERVSQFKTFAANNLDCATLYNDASNLSRENKVKLLGMISDTFDKQGHTALDKLLLERATYACLFSGKLPE